MDTARGARKALTVAVLLPKDQALMRELARRWGSRGVVIQKLSKWEEITGIYPEVALVTSPAMLQQCPPGLRPRVMGWRERLMVIMHRQEATQAISQVASMLLPHASDLVLMGIDTPIIMPLPIRWFDEPPSHNLSDRELQVLRDMAEGMSNKQIASDLGVDEETIKTHASRLFEKLGTRTRTQSVAIGIRRGIIN